MDGFKLSLLTLLLFAFACTINGKPAFHPKGGEKDVSDKSSTTTTTTAATTAKSEEEVEEATKKAINPSTACGGLKGFLHLCEAVEDRNAVENSKVQEVKEGSGDKPEGNAGNEEKGPKPDAGGKPESPVKRQVEKRQAEESGESDESSSTSTSYRRRVAKPENVEFQGEFNRERTEVESSESDSFEYEKTDEEDKGGSPLIAQYKKK